MPKVNLLNGFPFWLELFHPSFCDQSEPFKWVSILTGVVLPLVLWPKRTFKMGFYPHWGCFYPSFCDKRQPLKWVSILTGVVLPFVLWPKRTFEMGFHPHWSCFTLRSVTKENLLNGFPFITGVVLPSFCDQSEPLKWVSILTGVVLPFVLWPKWTFEMGFHSHWSCFTLRSVTKENLWNGFPNELSSNCDLNHGFPFSLELFYPSFCDQSEPLKCFHPHWSCFTLRSVTKDNLWNGFPSSLELFYPSFCDQILTGTFWNGFPFSLELFYPSFCDQSFHPHWNLWNGFPSILTGVVLPFVLWQKTTFEMGFHPHWSCFTVRSVTKENLWNGFPSSLELFYPSFCDQSEPFKWVSILTGVVLLFVLWPKRTFEMGFHPHWSCFSCFTLRSVTKVNLLNGFPFSLELFYSSNCDQSEPLKWVSILTGVVLPFVLWPKRTFEMGFHSHWSCFTLRSVTKVNLWNGFPSSLELVLWPKWTFEMGFHSNWSCFTLRSVTKDNLWNGFPSSLELFYPSFCDQREPLKWVSILTGVVLLFVLWPKTTFVMGFHSHWSCFNLRSVTKYNLWNGFPFSLELCYPSFCDQSEPLKWVSILTGVVLPFVLWQKTTFEIGFHPHWSCFTVRSVTKLNL